MDDKHCPVCGTVMEFRRELLDFYYGPVTEESHDCPSGHYSLDWAYGAEREVVEGKEFVRSSNRVQDDIVRRCIREAIATAATKYRTT